MSLLVSPTDDAEIGTEEPEKARFGSIEIRNFQTAGRMTNQWPGIKGVTPVRRPDAVAKRTRQADAVGHHLLFRSGKSYPESCKCRTSKLWTRQAWWEGAIEPPVAVEQKCWTDPGKMPS